MEALVTVLVVVVGLVLAVWAGSRMLRGGGPTSSGNAFGGFDVFDPGRERAEHDLESQKHQAVVTPDADGDDRPMRLDTSTNSVQIRPPSPPLSDRT